MNLNNLIQYCRLNNMDDPLAGIQVPEPLNPAAVRAAIVVRCGLLTPIYNNPDVFRQITADWFFNKQWNFAHLVKVLRAEYSPIENYDRYEEYEDTHTGTVTNDGGSKDTHSGEDKRTGGYTDTNSGQDETTNEVSAENANDYQPDTKSTDKAGKVLTNTHNDTDQYGHIIDRKDNNTRTDDLKDTHKAHLHGNIGTTKNTEMMLDEIAMIGQFDPYKWIASQFENDMMIMLY